VTGLATNVVDACMVTMGPVMAIFAPSKLMRLDQMAPCSRPSVHRQGQQRNVADFAVNFPISIFLNLVGLPQKHSAHFLN